MRPALCFGRQLRGSTTVSHTALRRWCALTDQQAADLFFVVENGVLTPVCLCESASHSSFHLFHRAFQSKDLCMAPRRLVDRSINSRAWPPKNYSLQHEQLYMTQEGLCVATRNSERTLMCHRSTYMAYDRALQAKIAAERTSTVNIYSEWHVRVRSDFQVAEKWLFPYLTYRYGCTYCRSCQRFVFRNLFMYIFIGFLSRPAINT